MAWGGETPGNHVTCQHPLTYTPLQQWLGRGEGRGLGSGLVLHNEEGSVFMSAKCCHGSDVAGEGTNVLLFSLLP